MMREPAIMKRDHPSLAAYLPYDSYDPGGGIFIHRDGSLAVGWSTGMIACETAPEGEMEVLSARWADFFKLLPARSAAQVILMADRDVRESIRPWKEGPSSDPALEELFEARTGVISDLELRHGGAPYVARSLRLFLTLRVFPSLGEDEAALRADYAREKAKLLETATAVENFLTQMGMAFERLEAARFVHLLYRILNPGRARGGPRRPYREELPLRDQVVRSAGKVDFSTGTVELDGVSMRVLSMVETPRATEPGGVTRPLPSRMNLLSLIPEAILVWDVEVLDDYEARRRLEKRNNFAWQQLQNPRKKLDLVEIKKDAEGALGELLAGRRALSARFHVLVSDPDASALPEKANSAIAALDRSGIEMIAEESLALTVLLQCLPMAYDPAGDRGLKRARTMISTNLADLLPVYGAFRGTPSPEILLQNRLGEPVTFSFFDADVAPHGIVTGVSGSGKSFFTNYLLASARRRGAHVFVLDRGNSYRKICELAGGEYVAFDADRPKRINPCGHAGAFDHEKHIALGDLVAEMCSQGGADLTRTERSLILRAIARAFEEKPGEEVFLSDIRGALLKEAESAPAELSKVVHELALSMEPFTGKGPYAGFFDGPNEVDFGTPFTVFELGEIALRKDIASVLLLALLSNIGDFSGAPERLGQRKYLVVDEAWTLLKSPMTARFIENALRTYRKYNAAAIMVTQQVEDFEGPAARAIRANAPNRVFLMQTAETVLTMEKLLDLGPEDKAAIASVTTAKGKFSEMFIQTPSASGVARLVADPYFYWLATSRAEDNAHLAALAGKHRSAGAASPLLSAIREAASGGILGVPPPAGKSREARS
jgi:conjugal transfer ATP-binding protein TraC